MTPECAHRNKQMRLYCDHTQDYPEDIVIRIAKYYQFPLDSVFKELRAQVKLKVATVSSHEALVCESVTRRVRVGWANNVNGQWLVVLNTDRYQQHVTEVLCMQGNQATCSYVPVCFRARCLQRYNLQKLLVIDPQVPHAAPFLSEFLFPSSCVCHVEFIRNTTGQDK